MKSIGKPLEDYVAYIFNFILNHKSEGITVLKNAYFLGRSNSKHEIDVYYAFTKAGIYHRVAIECKNTNTPVDKGRVQEFHAKIRDIGWDITGIMVSKSGYQEGALKFAEHHDIRTLTETDLPSLPSLLVDRIQTRWMLSEDYIGEPFWGIIEILNGDLTGNYLLSNEKGSNGERCIPFFLAKSHAEAYLKRRSDSIRWTVRGLPQFALASVVGIAKKDGLGFLITFVDTDDLNKDVTCFFYRSHHLQKEFILPKYQI